MASLVSERLFSLELLIDWVCLWKLAAAATRGCGREQKGGGRGSIAAAALAQPVPRGGLPPAGLPHAAWFTLLPVFAAPALESRPGLVSFRRGKSCLSACSPPPCTACPFDPALHLAAPAAPRGTRPPPRSPGGLQHLSGRGSPQGPGVRRPGSSQSHRGSFPLWVTKTGSGLGTLPCATAWVTGSSLLGHLMANPFYRRWR